eukprot:scaffold11536_cov107-Isochrysis_galbana.AAC.5
MESIPRYTDTTLTPAQRAKVKLLTHELNITHPHLPGSFIDQLALLGALCTEHEIQEMLDKN